MATQKPTITQDILQFHLTYDKDTGIFRRARGKNIGKEPGTTNNNGYRMISVCGWPFSAHRLAWLYSYGTWPEGFLDHINGVKTDNRLCNLREVSISENNQNKNSAMSNNRSSKYLGVTRPARYKSYRAQIHINGKYIFLGYHKTEEEAHEAYEKAKMVFHIQSKERVLLATGEDISDLF